MSLTVAGEMVTSRELTLTLAVFSVPSESRLTMTGSKVDSSTYVCTYNVHVHEHTQSLHVYTCTCVDYVTPKNVIRWEWRH